MNFELNPAMKPSGDQPQAIEKIVDNFKNGVKAQVLLGVTGSGKTFTMANVIAQLNRPTLVIAHNKTLAGQLCNEFRELFPNNRVEYFVSYYDYYQPEAYISSTDTYIEKDMSINDEIDKMRHSATSALLERNDVIVVASVSCIYGLGAPSEYFNLQISLREGMDIDPRKLISNLIAIQYERNDFDFHRGTFRVKGDIIDIFPINSSNIACRVEFFGSSIDKIYEIVALTGKIKSEVSHIAIYPASHYAISPQRMKNAIKYIADDRDIEEQKFQKQNKFIEAQRIRERVSYDLEMMQEIGYCNGIENYSRYFDGREAGQPPFTLMDYFPNPPLIMIDESHITLPQVRGMFAGDRARKDELIKYGFRLPSAYDNRPLNFDEFLERIGQVMFVSATPNQWEIDYSNGEIAEQIIRPTGLLDPIIEVKPSKNQILDLLGEINSVISRNERILVTTLTKRMAEDLTDYLVDHNVKACYLHSDIDTLERLEIILQLRSGKFDVIVGINLLREGLDMPEVSLVAILDADKEGFLRSSGALIQSIGRAARNVNGRAIMYADNITKSMSVAINETARRRKIQTEYNEKHNITPKTIIKSISDMPNISKKPNLKKLSPQEKAMEIERLMEELKIVTEALDFEKAIEIRDYIIELKGKRKKL